MKSTIFTFILGFVATVHATENTAPIFPAAGWESAERLGTNLISFSPGIFWNGEEMVRTNGLECKIKISDQTPTFGGQPLAQPPVCYLYVVNNTTNELSCLNLPVTNICRLALLDAQKHLVEKTDLGKQYGWPLTEAGVEQWRQQRINSPRHRGEPYQSMFIKILPNGIPQYDFPTETTYFSVVDAFKITSPGEYELHAQLRLVQLAKDTGGNLHYPITALPEVVVKFKITADDLPKN